MSCEVRTWSWRPSESSPHIKSLSSEKTHCFTSFFLGRPPHFSSWSSARLFHFTALSHCTEPILRQGSWKSLPETYLQHIAHILRLKTVRTVADKGMHISQHCCSQKKTSWTTYQRPSFPAMMSTFCLINLWYILSPLPFFHKESSLFFFLHQWQNFYYWQLYCCPATDNVSAN